MIIMMSMIIMMTMISKMTMMFVMVVATYPKGECIRWCTQDRHEPLER